MASVKVKPARYVVTLTDAEAKGLANLLFWIVASDPDEDLDGLWAALRDAQVPEGDKAMWRIEADGGYVERISADV